MAKARKIKSKPWGGRFREGPTKLVEMFTESVSFDQRLALYDIQGSIAYAEMLARCGIIKKEERRRIILGLEGIREDVESGKFKFESGLEDVHMNIEARLIEDIGSVGGKLHTGRSRNDQVALDIRLYLKDVLTNAQIQVLGLKSALLNLAHRYVEVVMPGYTHMRRAQPVLFAHHVLAYVEQLNRDGDRMSDCMRRMDVLPLGSGALSGTGLPIDRACLAELLGFRKVSQNSIDAVSDRDFAVEFLSSASLIMMHLSRLTEEWIIWSGAEFDYITLPESYCTGSSMMPQKRNPDVLELVRGKTGRVYGSLMSLLTILKSQPMAYNRDLQEDKEPLFNTADTLLSSLFVLTNLVEGVEITESQKLKMRNAAKADFSLATELADYLSIQGVPFRKAHEVVGRIVRHCEESGTELSDLSLPVLRRFSKSFGKDILKRYSLDAALKARDLPGGTAPSNVKRMIRREKKRCADSLLQFSS